MKNPKILYILISIFCLFAIIAGIYAQLVGTEEGGGVTIANDTTQNVLQEQSQEALKADFNALFTNTLNLGGFDTTGIVRVDSAKDIVYSAYDIDQDTANYELNIHIPVININSELANNLNIKTQEIFVNKANEVIQSQNTDIKTIYSIDYTAYINRNILSLVIKSTLKEGDSAQRIIVQTYNYNLDTNQEVPLIDLITAKRLNRDDVEAEIMEVVSEANAEDQALQSMGLNPVYIRDLESDIYTIENAGAYFLGPEESLYIVYAYGNGEFTSKMDIVYFE